MKTPDDDPVVTDVPPTPTEEAVKDPKPKRKRPVKPVLRPGAKKAPAVRKARAAAGDKAVAKAKAKVAPAKKPTRAVAKRIKDANTARATNKAAAKKPKTKAPAKPARKGTKPVAGTAAAKKVDVSAKPIGPGVPNAGPAIEKGIAAFGNRRVFAEYLGMKEQNVGRVLRVHKAGFAFRVPNKFVIRLAAVSGIKPADIDPQSYLPNWTVPRFKPEKVA